MRYWVLACCLFVLPHAASSEEQTCYWPDGSVAAGTSPCNPTSANSACCQNPGNGYCLSNGLCFNDGGNNYMTRFACTDLTWQSKDCPQYCQTVSKGGPISLLACGDPSNNGNGYCCGVDLNAQACCNNGGSFIVQVGYIISASALSSSTTASMSSSAEMASQSLAPSVVSQLASSSTTASLSSSTKIASQSLAPSVVSQPASSQDSTTSLGLGLGLGLGIPMFIATLAIILLVFKLSRRLDKEGSAKSRKSLGQMAYKPTTVKELPISTRTQVLEMDSFGRQEMP